MNEIVLDKKIKKDVLTHIGFHLLQRHVTMKYSKRGTFKFACYESLSSVEIALKLNIALIMALYIWSKTL